MKVDKLQLALEYAAGATGYLAVALEKRKLSPRVAKYYGAKLEEAGRLMKEAVNE